MDDLTVVKMSLDENLKRKQLLPSEVSHALTELYEEWKESKQGKSETHKKKIYMISGHDDQKIEENKKYIKDIENMGRSRERPEDPFAVSKFVEESNVPLRRREVERLLAIDSLPMDVKKGLDEGYIDMLTAYELTKFSRNELEKIFKV